MTTCISVLAQKGGVGKSTITRLIATEYENNKKNVLIADMDVSQSTCYEWNQKRINNNIKPKLVVEKFATIDQAIQYIQKNHFDIVIFDGTPHSTYLTQQIAKICHINILPTGNSLEDLDPQIKLAHSLKEQGIDANRLIFVLSRVGNSLSEIEEVKKYLMFTEYTLLDDFISEKTAFRNALNIGKSISETRFRQLNIKTKSIFNSLKNIVNKLTD